MPTEQKTYNTMTIMLWIVQVLLALLFIWAGFMKIVHPEKLPFPWVKTHENLVLLTGIADLLGGIGIILPTLLNVQPRLTIIAAYGIIVLMLAASIFHISRNEAKDIGFNIVMALLAVFVAWGRQKNKPNNIKTTNKQTSGSN